MKADLVFEAGADAMRMLQGSYSCICLVHGVGTVAFRDPFGIRQMSPNNSKQTSYQDPEVSCLQLQSSRAAVTLSRSECCLGLHVSDAAPGVQGQLRLWVA